MINNYYLFFYLGIFCGYFLCFFITIVFISFKEYKNNRKLLLMSLRFRLDYQKFILSMPELIEQNKKDLDINNLKKAV